MSLAQKSLAQYNGSAGDAVRDDQIVSGSSMVSLGGLSIANLERMVEMKRNENVPQICAGRQQLNGSAQRLSHFSTRVEGGVRHEMC